MAEGKQQQASTYKGWLYKWTNYLKGYQKRWFVLQNGLLSYYRNQAEMTHTCRGTINLATAFIHIADSCTIVISSGGNHTFHLKATSEVDRQKWVTALELAKADAVRMLEPDSDEEEPDKNDIQTTIKNISSKLEDLNTCNDLIGKHGGALQRALNEVEQLEGAPDIASKIKVINERATMFRITTNAMINACSEFLELAQTDGKRWHKMLEHEYNQKLKLQELLEQLAKDQNTLEIQAKKSMAVGVGENSGKTVMKTDDHIKQVESKAEYALNKLKVVKEHSAFLQACCGVGSGSEEEDFEDALDYQEVVTFPVKQQPSHRRTDSFDTQMFDGEEYSTESDIDENEGAEEAQAGIYQAKSKKLKKKAQNSNSESSIQSTNNIPANSMPLANPKKIRRTVLPPRPNHSLNLWGIMRNCIGKELSKIPMPVNFSEPLSMLQRVTEDFEYSNILDEAVQCEDSTEQMAFVTAFTVSSYSTTINRTTKPFNPLLGETYDCDRLDDLGWRSIAEQVSHHPPTAALCTDGRGWKLWQEFTMNSKFRGKYLQIIPTGIAHLVFENSGNHYTWRKVTTTVHNIIVGRLWVDHHGEMDIVNHTTDDKCHLKYNAYSYFSREKPRKVTGVVTDKNDKAKWVITGTWDTQIETSQVLHVDDSSKRTVFATGPKRVLWKRRHIPPGADKMYFFTQLAIQLNEPDDTVAPTDATRRPDQRLMEDGDWDEANRAKVKLEEKQRAKRRRLEAEAEESLKRGEEPPCHKPVWFEKQKDEITGELIYVSNNRYWECKEKQDWHGCPDIFL